MLVRTTQNFELFNKDRVVFKTILDKALRDVSVAETFVTF